MFIARLRPALAGLLLVVFASVASAQDKPTLTATVNGSTVRSELDGRARSDVLRTSCPSRWKSIWTVFGRRWYERRHPLVSLRDPTSCKSEPPRGRSRGRFRIR